MCFSDEPAEDQLKSSNVVKADLVLLESPQQEVENPVEGSTAVAQEILGCHSALAVSSFLCLGTFVESSSAPYRLVLLAESG